MRPVDLQQILSAPYDRVQWLETIREVLPGAAVYLSPQEVTTPVTNAHTIVQLGEIAVADGKNLALLEVEVVGEVDLARNRAGLRAVAARFIDLSQYHGVLAVFRKSIRDDWRLTLAAREAAFDEQSQEFAIQDTAPRRYTYLLGPNETCLTPAERLLGLRSRGTAATLANIVEAFSVEQLNKEFFRDFCVVFNLVSAELKKRFPEWEKAEATRDLAAQEAQILLNRLLFLYFVQRKGWLHRNSRYLVSHFRDHHQRHEQSSSYYERFLFPVFRILATEWTARDKTVSHLTEHDPNGHDLPFLNGGLFHDDDLNDDASRRRRNLAIKNVTFAQIFDDLLERYNFTIREDSPLDQEVAIDPEMLGKIFEELILREEAGEKGGRTKRHDTGSHYTPRPIVHYICRESLAAWLENQLPFAGRKNAAGRISTLLALDAAEGLDDDSLCQLRSKLTPDEAGQLLDTMNSLRACDPAVGSGAFPIGLLHELLNLAHLAETRARGHNPAGGDLGWSYDTKKRFIQHTLYGVDIQERATEICKLRLWLSLMVDHDLGVDPAECDRRSFQVALRKLEPLPNLDFKIRRANSLVDTIHGHIVELRTLSHEPGANKPLQQLAGAKLAFFNARKQEEKRKLRSEIYEALAELGQLELRRLKIEAAGLGLSTDDDDLRQLSEMQAAESELANALKVAKAARSRNESAATRERMLEKLEEFFGDSTRPTFVWQLDFAEVFHREERSTVDSSITLRQTGSPTLPVRRTVDYQQSGFDVLIGNPPYVRIQSLAKDHPELTQYFRRRYQAASRGNYDLCVVFVERGLELLTHDGQLGYILPHRFFKKEYGERLRDLLSSGRHVRHIVNFGHNQIFPGATNYVCLLFLSKVGVLQIRVTDVDNLDVWLKSFEGTDGVFPSAFVTSAPWNLVVGRAHEQFEKMQRIEPKLEKVASVFVGVQTSADDVFIMLASGGHQGTEIQLESKALGRNVVLEKRILRPLLSGTDVSAFSFLPMRQFILYPYEVKGESARLYSLDEIRKMAPKAEKYLRDNFDRLRNREQGKFDDEHWYRFGRSQNIGIQHKSKVCVPRLVNPLCATFDEQGTHCLDNVDVGGVTLMPKTNNFSLSYLVALLNSSALRWFFPHVSEPYRGGWYSANRQFLDELPMPEAQTRQREAIELLVGHILFLHQQPTVRESTPKAPRDPIIAQYFERWVDAMVYQLFFPEELQAARLDFFLLLSESNLADVDKSDRLDGLRKRFEDLYDPKHPLRGALFALQSLEFVREIEGEE